jgi:hypothetical protein
MVSSTGRVLAAAAQGGQRAPAHGERPARRRRQRAAPGGCARVAGREAVAEVVRRGHEPARRTGPSRARPPPARAPAPAAPALLGPAREDEPSQGQGGAREREPPHQRERGHPHRRVARPRSPVGEGWSSRTGRRRPRVTVRALRSRIGARPAFSRNHDRLVGRTPLRALARTCSAPRDARSALLALLGLRERRRRRCLTSRGRALGIRRRRPSPAPAARDPGPAPREMGAAPR